MSAKITADHLGRQAIVYVRQSTPGQVKDHLESRRRQYALAEHARSLGFVDVQVIDDDMGRSGTGFADRPGFRRLLGAVCSGAVGAVLALEASRLARNDRDWSHLVEVGAISHSLLIDHDGVYDPRIVNDRLLLGLKGIMSEFEMATLRQRALEAVRGKAARGDLRLPLPAGLVYGPTGVIELVADKRIQHVIRLLLGRFHELGSVRQALLWFRREGLQLPVVRLAKDSGREIEWTAATYDRIHAVITNPFYAGAYAYGRSGSKTQIVDGAIRRSYHHAKPMQSWQVLLRDHHAGYISWDDFLRNMTMLEENTFMKPATGRKSARGGRSLLSGLLRCRRCGHVLEVNYGRTGVHSIGFRCRRSHLAGGADWCISFQGNHVEQAIAAQVLRAVEGPATDAAIEAAKRSADKRLEQRKALSLELEQARFEAQLAGRRHEKVDPDQRLVAAELEVRWNAALERVAAIETRLREFDAGGHVSIQVDEGRLRALAAHLPAVWNDDTTDMRLKQRIVRILIREIIADVDDVHNEIVLTVHWQGGRHTELRIPKAASGRTRRCTDDDSIAIVRRMAGRWSDHAIASTLNRVGSRTGTGKTWNQAHVRTLRSRLRLPACDPERRDDTALTCDEAAKRLGISAQYLGQLLAKGLIPGTQVTRGAPWILDAKELDSPQVRATLRALRQRRLPKRRDNDRTPRIPGL
ncbi:MAG: recombinase family protein [Solirubrobacterales bacterium]|nr:recombinase family protein [Solirubrobacterales bacterium]